MSNDYLLCFTRILYLKRKKLKIRGYEDGEDFYSRATEKFLLKWDYPYSMGRNLKSFKHEAFWSRVVDRVAMDFRRDRFTSMRRNGMAALQICNAHLSSNLVRELVVCDAE